MAGPVANPFASSRVIQKKVVEDAAITGARAAIEMGMTVDEYANLAKTKMLEGMFHSTGLLSSCSQPDYSVV